MSDLNWQALLDCTNSDIPRSTLANAVLVLQHDPEFGPEHIYYDEFLDRVLFANSPTRQWRDDDDTRLTVYMQQNVGMLTIAESHVSAAVRYVARQRTRHCVRDWMRGLAWDGTERIAHALEDAWGVEPNASQPSDYVRAISANLFIGIVARIMRPGCQLDTMLILEGAQGIGKSRSLRILGGDWYMLAAESITNKDFYQGLAGKMLVELGELDALSKAERERTKIAISTPTDRYRSSYGRHAIDHPRQCVFIGTTNRDDYGNDETGIRRFWPVKCGDINCDIVTALRDQWFAEAVVQFDAGATWWETPQAVTSVQRDRQHEDAWTATVLDWLTNKDETTSADILVNSPLKFSEGDISRTDQNRISTILALNGWRRQTIRWNGRPVKGFKKCAD